MLSNYAFYFRFPYNSEKFSELYLLTYAVQTFERKKKEMNKMKKKYKNLSKFDQTFQQKKILHAEYYISIADTDAIPKENYNNSNSRNIQVQYSIKKKLTTGFIA